MSKLNVQVDEFMGNQFVWEKELNLIREILNKTDLVEEYKWKHPCYTINGKNVVIMHYTKSYCGITFFKGILIKDELAVLKKIGSTYADRQLSFTKVDEIEDLREVILDYVKQAIDIELSGVLIEDPNKQKELVLPEELIQVFKDDSDFKEAFYDLTKGRQKRLYSSLFKS
jgi:uncharacterized protein YdeI (YjbR/CyaY-like superfamily)